MGQTVLVADDEEKIVRLVVDYLAASGFSTLSAKDGVGALRLARERKPDCAILDVGMPGMDGLEVVREIRKTDSNLPILFLSARAEETDRVVGLELGADDYLTKPFSPRELVARVKALLRRANAPTQRDATTTGGISVNRPRMSVTADGRDIVLTAVQFAILDLLISEPGRIFDRATILSRAIGSEFEGYERTIDAHVKNLRKALGDDADRPRYIGTKRGIGYYFIDPSREN